MEDDSMIVGIPTDDGQTVSGHFGKSKYFVVAKLDGGIIADKKTVENPHNKEATEQGGHGELLKMLVDNKVNVVVCTDLNPRMQENLESLGILVNRCGNGQHIDDLLRSVQP
ncbi:MAG: NifB/NifX family molybdenum-iron cluster-binding protein [Candidatus Micrarchaeaceae archaeon]